MGRRLGFAAAAAVVGMTLAGSAAAHHSSAMFDANRTVTLSGTVRMLQWTSPHCWLQVLVPSDNGVAEWSIEMAAPFEMMRRGWKPVTVRPGDKISVVANPARDGSNGAMFISATGVDGHALGQSK